MTFLFHLPLLILLPQLPHILPLVILVAMSNVVVLEISTLLVATTDVLCVSSTELPLLLLLLLLVVVVRSTTPTLTAPCDTRSEPQSVVACV